MCGSSSEQEATELRHLATQWTTRHIRPFLWTTRHQRRMLDRETGHREHLLRLIKFNLGGKMDSTKLENTCWCWSKQKEEKPACDSSQSKGLKWLSHITENTCRNKKLNCRIEDLGGLRRTKWESFKYETVVKKTNTSALTDCTRFQN